MSRSARSSGVFTTDTALVVQSWDPWLADVTGLPEVEACGRPIGDLFPDLADRGLLARLLSVAATGTVELVAPAFHECFLVCAPRVPTVHFTRMQQHATITPLHDGDAIVGVAVTIRDVTARCERERQLAAELGSTDEGVRLHAVHELAAVEGASAPLGDALGDPSWRVRRAAADGLARTGDVSAARVLVDTIGRRHRDPAALNAAIAALARTGADAVPAVVALLDAPDADAEVRTYAALALGLIGARAAVPALARRLDDADANVRFHAIEALGRIGAREAAPALAELAGSGEFSVAFAALDALALIGEPSVAERLLPLLDDALLQTAAAEALARIGGEEAVAPLVDLVRRHPERAAAVAPSLAVLHARLAAEHGTGDLVAELTGAALSADAEASIVAALATASDADAERLAVVLAWRCTASADAALASLLLRAGVRRTAAQLLAARGAASVESLIPMLTVDDDEAVKAAAAALGQIGRADVAVPLAALLDAAAEVAVVAAGGLGSIGDPRALEPLVRQLDHPHPAVRQASVAALNSIAHPAMPDRVRALLAHPSPRVRESAARIAGYFGYPDCTEPMLALCADPEEPVRRIAVEQLPQFDDPRARAALHAALVSGTPGERAAAARALAHADPSEALPRLLAASLDADPWVRYYAARSLGRQGGSSGVPALVALATDDPIPPVRVAAVEALGQLGAAHAVAALGSLASDRDAAVAGAALTALARLPGDGALGILLTALGGGERELQEAALGALGERADGAAVPAVARIAAGGADPEMRVLAMQVLGDIGTEGAVDALVALTAEPRRAATAVTVLARLAEGQVPWVARGLTHPDIEVRCAIADALARSRSHAAIAALRAALDDPAPAVRLAAAAALRRIDLHDAHDPGAVQGPADADLRRRRTRDGGGH